MYRGRDRSRAFTFLEMMLVLGIVGMLALIVMPDFRSFQRRSTLESLSRRVIGLMRLARAQAIADGEYIVLDLDLEERTIKTRKESDARDERRGEKKFQRDKDEDELFRFPKNSYVAEFNVPKEFEGLIYDAKRKARIYFYPDGTASPVLLTLAQERPSRDGKDIRTRFHTIEIYRTTGLTNSYAGRADLDDGQARRPPREPLAGRRAADEGLAESIEYIRRGRN